MLERYKQYVTVIFLLLIVQSALAQQPAVDTTKPGGKKLFIKQAKKLNFLKIKSLKKKKT